VDSTNITSLSFDGNHAHITGNATTTAPNTGGSAKKKQKSQTISFTIDVVDNGDPGSNDMFAIQLSTGYSASGQLTSGNITIH
jgi:hypothetical protein